MVEKLSKSQDQRNKALFIGTIIYAIGNFGTKFLSFLIVPLYTYYISPADMGDYDILCTTVNLLTPLITMQISDAAFRWMISDRKNVLSCVSATYKLIFVNGLITIGIILAVNFFIPITYCYYFIAILILGRILGSMQKLLRGLKNQKLFALSGVVYTAVFLFLNLLLVCVFKMGVVALLWSTIIANIVAIAFVLILEKDLRKFDIKTKHFNLQKQLLRYSIPLVPSTLNWWVMSASNRYFIRYFMSNAANGIFAVANKFPSILSTVFLMFNNSWTDMALAESGNKDDSSEYYSKIFEKLYVFSFTSLFILVPATKLVTQWILSTDYKEASIYIAFLYLGTVFQAFSSFYSVGYLKRKATVGAAATSIYGALVNVIVNLFFIKYIGLHAASISTFLGFFVMWIIRMIQTRESLPIRINKVLFSALFLIGLGICLISIWSSVMLDLILCFVGLLLFVLINREMIVFIIGKLLKRK